MKTLKCEMCAHTDVVKQGELYCCQHCGVKYEPEAAKRLLVEVEMNVTVDGIATVLSKARRAFEQLELGETAKAETAYEAILEADNDSFLGNLGLAVVENVKQINDKKIMHYLDRARVLSHTASELELAYLKQTFNYCGLNERNNGGIPILVAAVGNQSYAATRFLLEHGADPNIRTLQGRKATPLFFACYNSMGKPEAPRIVDLLLQHGAKIDAVTTDGIGIISTHTSDDVIAVIKKHHPYADTRRTNDLTNDGLAPTTVAIGVGLVLLILYLMTR